MVRNFRLCLQSSNHVTHYYSLSSAGLNVYRAALQDPTITSITLLMRREMPSWAELPANASQKTETIIQQDFLSYSPDVASTLAQHDACIWALGKSARGMSEADYTVITYDYPMALLRAIEEAGVGKDRPADKPFRFLYFSGELADPTGKSGQMWARVKVCASNYASRVKFSCKQHDFAGPYRDGCDQVLRRRARNARPHHSSCVLPPSEKIPRRLGQPTHYC